MFQLRHLSLTQYKNYFSQSFSFSKKVIGICGANGTGKTNLLDAIWYLCFTKSYFSADSQTSTHGNAGFRVEGLFNLHNDEAAKVVAVLRETGKKEISLNDEQYGRFGAHIGKLPTVMIAPDDVAVITGGSEERRKLFDTLLCQISPGYLQSLMDYNKLLQQRNSLLKQMAEQRNYNEVLLSVLDSQLAGHGVDIYNQRSQFLKEFLRQAVAHYHTIAQTSEDISVSYESQLNSFAAGGQLENTAAFVELLAQSRAKDMAVQRSTAGIHRDDLKLQMNGFAFKQVASQGQRKSLLFALKLTEFEMLQQYKGFAPLLLLDDVFEKLDNQRMTNLLAEVCLEKQGQVFITDTHRGRLEEQLAAIGCSYEIIEVGQGA